MNQTQRRTYSSSAKRVQRRMEVLFIPSVYKVLKAQIKFFTSRVRIGISPSAALNSMPVMDDKMAEIIESLHLKAGLFAARDARKVITRETAKSAGAAKGLYSQLQPSLQLKRGGFGFNERMTREIQEYFRLHLLEKAVIPITATTRVRIETVLNKAAEEGWSVERILDELEGEGFLDMTRRRARTIVRTETVRASNFGTLAAADDSEFEQVKIWVAVDDPRTRRTHRHITGVDGEQRDLLNPFSNGLMFPGDPNGAASECVNCRCTMAIRAKRDAQGRLVPKKKPGLIISLASRLTDLYRRIAAMLSSL